MKVLLLASASLLLVAGGAQAAQKAPAAKPAPAAAPAQPPAPSASASSVTDAEVAAVAVIGVEAKRLQDAAAPGIAAASTPEDKRKAQYALDDQTEALFKANSITFDRYNAIAGQAQTDKELAARIASARKSPPSPSASSSTSPASATAPDAAPSKPGAVNNPGSFDKPLLDPGRGDGKPGTPDAAIEPKLSTDPGKGDAPPASRPAPPAPTEAK